MEYIEYSYDYGDFHQGGIYSLPDCLWYIWTLARYDAITGSYKKCIIYKNDHLYYEMTKEDFIEIMFPDVEIMKDDEDDYSFDFDDDEDDDDGGE